MGREGEKKERKLNFVGDLLCARPCMKHFTVISPYSSHPEVIIPLNQQNAAMTVCEHGNYCM